MNLSDSNYVLGNRLEAARLYRDISLEEMSSKINRLSIEEKFDINDIKSFENMNFGCNNMHLIELFAKILGLNKNYFKKDGGPILNYLIKK